MDRNPIVNMNGFMLSRIWHCFGNYMHSVDLDTVHRMLDASDTNVIPVNTHKLSEGGTRSDLLIGFGTVAYDRLAQSRDVSAYTHMLNINHQTSAAAAVNKTLRAFDLLPEPVIKIEVLNDDLKTSNNGDLLLAVRELRRKAPHLALMPLLSCDLETAKELVDLGCPVLRVMGTPIGAGAGLADPETFSEICGLRVPVVLDGGVGSPSHFAQASRLGAQGCLVNSMLFTTAEDPALILRKFVDQSNEAIEQMAA